MKRIGKEGRDFLKGCPKEGARLMYSRAGGIGPSQDSLFEAGAILPASQCAFGNSELDRESVDAGSTPIEHSDAIVYVYSCRHVKRMTHISQRKEYLGFPMEAWLGAPDLRLQLAHEEDVGLLSEALEHSYRTGEKFSGQYRLYDSNRKVHWLRDEANMICDEAGVPRFAWGIMLDITAKKEMEAELDRYRHRFEQQIDERTNQLNRRMELLRACNAFMGDKLAQARGEIALLKQQAVQQQARIDEYAHKIIELTERAKSVRNHLSGEDMNRAASVRPTGSDEQMEGISEWARNMIGWRMAAAGGIA